MPAAFPYRTMRLIGRISARLPPDAGLTNVAHRGLLAATAPRLRGRDDRAARAIARAARTTALGRFTPAERAWIERMEARRERMAAEYTLPGADAVDGEPSPTPAKRIPKRWTPPFQRSMPRIWGTRPRTYVAPGRNRGRAAVV